MARYVGSKHHGLLYRSWGNSHQGRLLHRRPEKHLAGVSLYSLLPTSLRPNPRDKALFPQGPTWVRQRTENVHMGNTAPQAVLGVGPARGAALPRLLQQCLVRWSRQVSVFAEDGGQSCIYISQAFQQCWLAFLKHWSVGLEVLGQ